MIKVENGDRVGFNKAAIDGNNVPLRNEPFFYLYIWKEGERLPEAAVLDLKSAKFLAAKIVNCIADEIARHDCETTD